VRSERRFTIIILRMSCRIIIDVSIEASERVNRFGYDESVCVLRQRGRGEVRGRITRMIQSGKSESNRRAGMLQSGERNRSEERRCGSDRRIMDESGEFI